MHKFFAIAATLFALSAPAAADPVVTIGQGSKVWKEWSCTPAHGGIIGYAHDGPDVDHWVRLMDQHQIMQPPVWPYCPQTISQCKGREG